MKPGDVVLISLPGFAGATPKFRPALLLVTLPGPYQTHLICGISAQLLQRQPNWDELIQPGESDFTQSGLHHASIIRLSYLHATDPSDISGAIGRIDSLRLGRLLERLADHLRP
jgi:hypothetical protein